MIEHTDVIAHFIQENGWIIRDRMDISTNVVMLWADRQKAKITGQLFSLNIIINYDVVKVLNRYPKDSNYVEAVVSLFDPESLPSLEKVLQ